MQENSILTLKDYGRIEVRLKSLLDTRGMNRNQLATLVNCRFSVIDRWYENRVEKLDLDVLARICYALQCKPEDILSYEVQTKES